MASSISVVGAATCGEQAMCPHSPPSGALFFGNGTMKGEQDSMQYWIFKTTKGARLHISRGTHSFTHVLHNLPLCHIMYLSKVLH